MIEYRVPCVGANPQADIAPELKKYGNMINTCRSVHKTTVNSSSITKDQQINTKRLMGINQSRRSIYCVSDLHTDHEENWALIQRLDTRREQFSEVAYLPHYLSERLLIFMVFKRLS